MFDNEVIRQLAFIHVEAAVSVPGAYSAVQIYNCFKNAYEEMEAAYNEDARKYGEE
ncbi:MAG: hypothetical protein IJT37_03690 [Lachnospiraceae bacterium]|nr:hypothetical protein [Lachnospiraceae bacterium]